MQQVVLGFDCSCRVAGLPYLNGIDRKTSAPMYEMALTFVVFRVLGREFVVLGFGVLLAFCH